MRVDYDKRHGCCANTYCKIHMNFLRINQTCSRKVKSFFTRTQFDNVAMWKNKIMSCIENEDLSTRQIVPNSKEDDTKNSHDVRRFCRVTKKAQKRKRGKKQKKRQKRKTKKTKIPQQSSMQRFFELPQSSNENEDTQIKNTNETDQDSINHRL